MNTELFEKIKELAESKCVRDANLKWSKGSQTYIEELKKEIDEVQVELDANKQVYLEDELGDIFWDYMNILVNLVKEEKIESVQTIFERCEKKYSQRIHAIQTNISWDEIKAEQKKELLIEQEKKES